MVCTSHNLFIHHQKNYENGKCCWGCEGIGTLLHCRVHCVYLVLNLWTEGFFPRHRQFSVLVFHLFLTLIFVACQNSQPLCINFLLPSNELPQMWWIKTTPTHEFVVLQVWIWLSWVLWPVSHFRSQLAAFLFGDLGKNLVPKSSRWSAEFVSFWL